MVEVHHIIKNDKTVLGGVGNLGRLEGDRIIISYSDAVMIAKTDGTYGYVSSSGSMVIQDLKAGDTITALGASRDCCAIAL